MKRNGGITYDEIDFKTARPRGVVSPPHGERREGGGSWPRAREAGGWLLAGVEIEGGVETGKNGPDDALRAKIRLAPVSGAKSGLCPVKRWRHYARRRRKKCRI